MVLTLVSEVLQTCNLAVASSHLDDAVTRGCSRPGATVGTTLLFGDLDGDGKSDLITVRDGAGAVFSVFLSSQQKNERVSTCGMLRVPLS